MSVDALTDYVQLIKWLNVQGGLIPMTNEGEVSCGCFVNGTSSAGDVA